MPTRLLFALLSTILLLVPLTSAHAQRDAKDWRPDNREWEALGKAEIGTRMERDVIEVGRREGRFSAIGFEVSGSEVRIEDLRVVYVNGQVDELRVRDVFKSGTRSRPIDLPGHGQFIQRIEILYRAPGPVRIEFFGEKRREAAWSQLGCQRVGFLESKDTIRVGRREGAFRAIKLRVSDSTLRLMRLRVVFGDRETQVFDVKSAIPPGAETRPLDLDGRRRVIEKIDLEYLPSISLKRGSEVCVLALEGGGGPGDGRGLGAGPGPGPGQGRDRDRDRR